MTTDTPQNSSEHASNQVQDATKADVPVKDKETKSAIGEINSVEPNPAEELEGEEQGEDTQKELEEEEDEDKEEDEGEEEDYEDEDEDDEEEEEEEDDTDFDWGGRPRGRITTPISGGGKKK
ncbi:hypothetical protein M413DRAFT_440420 [Hebeloma cylindrosporum]|uniref:Uncharacterized protein n=1 Tax=Hebeloma cylindrosporum TaxID=76867 RepID=A0A0C3CSG6_HEBCY|nr:hypothetical protein M413DRAFT_440420 [Hebeloma cylindrosporum h7]